MAMVGQPCLEADSDRWNDGGDETIKREGSDGKFSPCGLPLHLGAGLIRKWLALLMIDVSHQNGPRNSACTQESTDHMEQGHGVRAPTDGKYQWVVLHFTEHIGMKEQTSGTTR
jgi:hypothetical protein